MAMVAHIYSRPVLSSGSFHKPHARRCSSSSSTIMIATKETALQQTATNGSRCGSQAGNEPALAVPTPLHAAFYPLHAAAMTGDVAKLTSLLESGMTPDHADFAGLTPLHIAAGSGNADMVKVLLDAKAKVAVADRRGGTPLSLAMEIQASAVEVLLRDAGASPDMKLESRKEPINLESQAALNGACGLEPMEVAAMQAAWSFLTVQHRPQDTDATIVSLAMGFFTLLFKDYPDLLEMFSFKRGANGPDIVEMEKHAVRVLKTLGKVLELLDDFPTLASVATGLTKRHVGYGVRLEHYDQVLGTLAKFLSSGLGGLGLWNDQQASAWTKLIALVKAVAAGAYTAEATA